MPNVTNVPSERDLSTIPTLARVALAARAALRARSVLDLAWSDFPTNYATNIDDAITVVSHIAEFSTHSVPPHEADSGERIASNLAEAAPNDAAKASLRAIAAASQTALRAAADTKNPTVLPSEQNKAGLAVAQAAAEVIAQSIVAARSYAGVRGADAMGLAISQDFQRLTQWLGDRRLINSVSVDPDSDGPLGVLWPEGEPNWKAISEKPKRQAIEPPTVDDLKLIPMWARVAFAVRCAMRVQPLARMAWPSAPDEQLRAIERAIGIAQHFSRTGRVGVNARDAYAASDAVSYAANQVLGAIAAGPHGTPSFPQPEQARIFAKACFAAANAATGAGDAASETYPGNSAFASNAASNAAAAVGRIELIYAMWSDYDLLVARSAAEKWNDDTPVESGPDGPLGALWPNGEPDWFPPHRPEAKHDGIVDLEDSASYVRGELANGKVDKSGRRTRKKPAAAPIPSEVTLHLPLPPLPDSPEVRALVVQRLRAVVHELSAAYVAAGGSGLLVKDAELHAEIPALLPVCGGGGGA